MQTPSLPDYELLSTIEHGGMGEVWRAVGRRTGSEVAVKFLRPSPSSSPSSVAVANRLARFELEIALLRRLDHPHIVRLLDSGAAADGTPFFCMELVDGQPLETWCAACKLRPRDLIALLLPVCQAVGHAHQFGIIHRDLKPANILVTAAGSAKLIDFGLAGLTAADSLAASLSRDGDLLGTPLYMAPEQAFGDPRKVGTPADVWALGVILHRLLTNGTHPFPPEGTTAEILARILRPESVKLSPFPDPDLAAIVGKCLAHASADRYPSGDALAADLRAWLDCKPITARSPGPLEMTWRFVRRHRYAVASSTVGLITISTLAAWHLHQKDLAAQRQARTLQQSRELLNTLIFDLRQKLALTGQTDLLNDAVRRIADMPWEVDVADSDGRLDTRRYKSLAAAATAEALLQRRDRGRARVFYYEAIKNLESLAADHPGIPDYQQDLAGYLYELSEVLLALGHRDEARGRLEESQARADAVASQINPPPASLLLQQIEVRRLLSVIALEELRPDAASAFIQAALESATLLRERQPADVPVALLPLLECDLALCAANTAKSAANLERLGKAAAALQQSLESESIIQPKVHWRTLFGCALAEAEQAMSLAAWEHASGCLDRASAANNKLNELRAFDPEARKETDLAESRRRLARALADCGRIPDAVRQIQTAVQLLELTLPGTPASTRDNSLLWRVQMERAALLHRLPDIVAADQVLRRAHDVIRNLVKQRPQNYDFALDLIETLIANASQPNPRGEAYSAVYRSRAASQIVSLRGNPSLTAAQRERLEDLNSVLVKSQSAP